LIFETYHNRHVGLGLAPFLALFIYGLWRASMGCGCHLTLPRRSLWRPAAPVPHLEVCRRETQAVTQFCLCGFGCPFFPTGRHAVDSGTVAPNLNANELAYRLINYGQLAWRHPNDGGVRPRRDRIALLLASAGWPPDPPLRP
jgi:hypothetical protein